MDSFQVQSEAYFFHCHIAWDYIDNQIFPYDLQDF